MTVFVANLFRHLRARLALLGDGGADLISDMLALLRTKKAMADSTT